MAWCGASTVRFQIARMRNCVHDATSERAPCPVFSSFHWSVSTSAFQTEPVKTQIHNSFPQSSLEDSKTLFKLCCVVLVFTEEAETCDKVSELCDLGLACFGEIDLPLGGL